MKLEFDSIDEVRAFVESELGYTAARSPTMASACAENEGVHSSMSDGEVANTLANIARRGFDGKIPAIKMFRAVTGADLRTSKAAIDNVWQ